MKIKDINNMSLDTFLDLFQNIFEKTKSIAIISYDKRPFKDKIHLIETFINEFENFSKEDKKIVIKHHPDLGDKFKIDKNITDISKREQKNAGLDKCTNEEYLLFNKMNNEYKLKFDIPFIYAVKGANKIDIVNQFKKRLDNNNIQEEFNESIKQVKKIAYFRLNEIINE